MSSSVVPSSPAQSKSLIETVKRVFRVDGWANFLTGVNASQRDKRTASFIANPQTFMQEDLERFFRGNDLARRICTLPAQDMTRKGYELDIEDSDPDTKKGINTYLKDRDWFKMLLSLVTFSRLYGRCYVLVGVDDGQDMKEPVDFENIRSIAYMNVLDPWALRVRELQRNPLAPNFGQPETFYVNITPAGGFQGGDGSTLTKSLNAAGGELTNTAQYGSIVHASRVLWIDGSLMTPYQQRFSGNNVGSSSNLAWCPDSIFVPLYSVIRDYDQSWDSSAILLQDFAQAVYKIKGLGEMMAANGEAEVRQRMAIVDESRSVLRAMLLDAEFEDFERKATPITGLPEMMDRWLQRVSAAAEIPIPLLFGSPTGGLNASDDGAYEGYYNLIEAKQQNDLEPVIRKMSRLVMRAKDNEGTKGVEPKTWSVQFTKLWSLSEKEDAELKKTVAETDAIYITNQVVTPNEIALSRFGGEKYSVDTTIDLDTHEAQSSMIGEVQSAEAAALIAQHNATVENPNGPAEVPEGTPGDPGKPASALEPHERATVGKTPSIPAAGAPVRPGTPTLLGTTTVSPGASGGTPKPAGAGGDNVQMTALNGAQVASLVAIITTVAAKEIPRDAAVQAISLSFQVTPEQADKILGSAGTPAFEPPKPEPPAFGAGDGLHPVTGKPIPPKAAGGKPSTDGAKTGSNPFAKKDEDNEDA